MLQNKPFGHHFDSTTLPAYTAEVVKLLAFVLHSWSAKSMVLPPPLVQLLQLLQNALSAGTGVDQVLVDMVHEVCLFL